MPQISSISDFKAYKYKDIKVYSSTEWLVDNRKKYRQVFEEKEVQYIYVDLSLVNKLYDRENWDLDVVLKCYKISSGKSEICTLKISKNISKAEHVVHIREGWGHKKAGSFWKKGKYCWEAFIDDEKISSKYFYVEDLKTVSGLPAHSALKVESIDYFEGNYDFIEEGGDKEYYVEFDMRETRYIFAEVTLENRLKQKDWYAEVFIKFYNESRDLKGEVIRLEKIKRGEKKITVTAGWGANVKGSWKVGRYDVEVIFQNKLIAYSSFDVGHKFTEGLNYVNYPEGILTHDQGQEKKEKDNKKSLSELNSLIGLKSIKKQIHDHTKYIRFLQHRRDNGFDETDSILLHCVFKGNPGTGKTTVARLLGNIYHHAGILEKGHVHEVGRVDLVGEYIGQTAPKVRDAIDKARGGVLFIDEAYSLARSNEDSKDFGREVIELLIKEMSHPGCDFMVIVAGYTDEMDTFVKSNPGLASRFKYYYNFPDYSIEELVQILDYFSQSYEIFLSPGARGHVLKLIQEEYRNRKKNFGNARYVQNLLEKAKINMGIRLMNESKKEWSREDLSTIVLRDVKHIGDNVQKGSGNIEIDERALAQALGKLDALIGLESVKKKLHDLVDIVRFRINSGKTVKGSFNLHTVLTGNPGTGKTTVTRICAEIFKALGILSKGHIVETDRQGLVAGYVGQTAIKTAEVIKEAIGGLLFIDEAYSLHQARSGGDFGDEAIQVLIKQMEDRRGDFFVFVAGYPKEMDAFIKMNTGLKSRFDLFLHFDDFSNEELRQIALSFIKDRTFKISSEAIKILSAQLDRDHLTKDKQFGNARKVRMYVDEIIRQQNLRIASEVQPNSPNYNMLIKKVDVINGIKSLGNESFYQRRTINF